ncbi:MAG: hypothetical protein ABMA25_01315 [Ilumatobacteraceae bacterium]
MSGLQIVPATETRIREIAERGEFNDSHIAELAMMSVSDFAKLAPVERANLTIGVTSMVVSALQGERNANWLASAMERLDRHIGAAFQTLDSEISKRDQRHRYSRTTALLIALAAAVAGGFATHVFSTLNRGSSSEVTAQETRAAQGAPHAGDCESSYTVKTGDSYQTIAFEALRQWLIYAAIPQRVPSELDLASYESVLIARNNNVTLQDGQTIVIPPVVPVPPADC